MLSLKEIFKSYKTGDTEVQALKGVSMDFRDSEFVSVLGPSGCGKTTLLNIIGGLDHYSSGDLIINQRSTKDFKDADWDSYRNHRVGFVFQSYNLIPHQTVLSNVELALTLSGVSKSERRKRAKEALEQVGLGDQLNKKPNQMSGGQMQRVAIARALVNDPDILLADEPTGALDTQTSVQIMEILKKISKDKLIVMVTHNPELAETYSSRIIKLLDGEVVSDSDPFTCPEPEQNEKLDKKAAKKAAKAERKKLKTSMSFLTALSLSKNNLLTKKARTILTSFAGSIGIIGIALILSLSNGVQVYIDQVQSDTLSSYPLTITRTTTSTESMMKIMAEGRKSKDVDHDKDKVYSQNRMGKLINSYMNETKVNNLEKFKSFLDDNNEIKDYVTSIQYSYSTTPYIYNKDTSKGVEQVNPSTIGEYMGMGESFSMSATMESASGMTSSMFGGQGTNIFGEMIDNDELIKKQYDLLAGKFPESYDEVVLVVDKNNEIHDYVLYTLGWLDKKPLENIVSKVFSGQKVEGLDAGQKSYTYDQMLALRFRLLAPTDRYEKQGNIWVDKSQDTEFMKKALEAAPEIKVVGVIRPNEDAAAASINGNIGYTHKLASYLVERVSKSEIVKQQLENKDTDVFTGLKFGDGKNKNKLTDAQKQMLQQQQQQGGSMMGMQIGGQSAAEMLTESEKKYMESLTPEQMQLIQQITKERMEMLQKGSGDGLTSDSTYDQNLNELGYAEIEKPSYINIYPKDFESKEKIVKIIEKYNEEAKNDGREDDTIEYTDYVGLMMSSITSIISAISYILIAFVAISLVVSSIMIGIITYISVLERTKEIGILRAIGASKKDISHVFNAETVIVGLVAGALGILVSYLLTIPINLIIASLTDVNMRAAIPVLGAVILVAISVFLTLIAGVLPSRIAAKKDPVVALRTE